jgi:hypothetical protein
LLAIGFPVPALPWPARGISCRVAAGAADRACPALPIKTFKRLN